MKARPTVLFETLWAEVSDGWAIAARAYARAMKMAGADVRLHSWAAIMEQPHQEVLAEVEGMLHTIPRWDFYVYSVPLASPEIMRHPFEVLVNMPRPRAFYTMFERSNVQAELVSAMNKLEGVWVPCSRNQDVLRDSGCPQATWIPYPYFDKDPHLKLPAPRKDPRVFYWIGRWEPRKAPDNLIRAFLRAFRPGEAELVLKLGPSAFHHPFPGPEEVIAAELDTNRQAARQWPWRAQVEQAIKVVREKLSPSEMLEIHARGDVYVSASRGEGIDLPAFAAKLAGRRVVTTDSGGPRDFLDEKDVIVPAPAVVPAKDYEDFWGEGSCYADYPIEELVTALQVARAEPVKKASKLPKAFRAENVGKRLLEWVEHCRGKKAI